MAEKNKKKDTEVITIVMTDSLQSQFATSKT